MASPTIQVTDIVTEVNAAANDLKADGADVIVLLVHEGAAGTDCATSRRSARHRLRHDHPRCQRQHRRDRVRSHPPGLQLLLPGRRLGSGRPVTKRPVVSAGQYGIDLNQIVFTVDTATGDVQAKTPGRRCRSRAAPPVSRCQLPGRPGDPDDRDDAVAAPSRSVRLPLGKIAGPFKRAKLADGTTENRGGESTWATWSRRSSVGHLDDHQSGGAQIAFMNPGGLRDDLVGARDGRRPGLPADRSPTSRPPTSSRSPTPWSTRT